MARRQIATKSKINLEVGGALPTVDRDAAILRAQEKNRDLLLRRVKSNFSISHRGPPDRPAGRTVQSFQAVVRKRDLNLSVFNYNPNAYRVEFGVEPRIGMLPKGSPSSDSPPARRIDGRPLLSFFWAREGKQMTLPYVRHPGQRADPVMEKTLNDAEGELFRNVVREVDKELKSRGG